MLSIILDGGHISIITVFERKWVTFIDHATGPHNVFQGPGIVNWLDHENWRLDVLGVVCCVETVHQVESFNFQAFLDWFGHLCFVIDCSEQGLCCFPQIFVICKRRQIICDKKATVWHWVNLTFHMVLEIVCPLECCHSTSWSSRNYDFISIVKRESFV